jgi:hypothetical protein
MKVDPLVTNDHDMSRKLRLMTGGKMAQLDRERGYERDKNEKGYKVYTEADRPLIYKAMKMALDEMQLSYSIPELVSTE